MEYDIESNILSIQISDGKINHVKEFGDFIIHLSKGNKPLLIEILEASRFIGKFILDKNIKNTKQVLSNI